MSRLAQNPRPIRLLDAHLSSCGCRWCLPPQEEPQQCEGCEFSFYVPIGRRISDYQVGGLTFCMFCRPAASLDRERLSADIARIDALLAELRWRPSRRWSLRLWWMRVFGWLSRLFLGGRAR